MVFVIRKKMILLTVAALMLAGGASHLANVDSSKETAALPGTDKVIVLDAGHGGEDGGAIGQDGTVEKDINLAVMKKLQALLEQSGCTVITTRTEDISLHESGDEKTGNRKIKDLNARKDIPGEYNADIFVSIHMNTFPDSKYKGAQVFYSSQPEKSKDLANCVQSELRSQVDGSNEREIKNADGNIYILNDAKIPSVVVECGFLSNAEEEAKLNSEEYQEKLAFAIYCGIIKYFAM